MSMIWRDVTGAFWRIDGNGMRRVYPGWIVRQVVTARQVWHGVRVAVWGRRA